jgi:hypothetical protein
MNRKHDPSVGTDGFKGWWKITPELELSGGVFGTAAGNGQGWDGRCKCYYAAGDANGGYGTSLGNDTAQIRLTYASGPISFAVAVEDSENYNNRKSAFGFAGEMKYSGDSYGFELNAGYWNDPFPNYDADWTVNAGANIGLGDIASLSMAVGVGEDQSHTIFNSGNSDRYTKGSLFVSFDLSDAVTAQLGVGHRNYKGLADQTTFGGGLYYTPVSQLTLGLEADYSDQKNAPAGVHNVDQLDVALVTIYRF